MVQDSGSRPEEQRQPGRGYFLGRGIPLSIQNTTAFTAALQAIFLRKDEVSWWIGNLANSDIRRSLDIARHIVSSPHIAVHELVTTYVTGSNFSLRPYKIKRALIRGQYDIYPGEANEFIRNIYTLDESIESSPLLGLRLLQLLKDARRPDAGERFISIEHVISYFQAMLIGPTETRAWLGKLLHAGLCLSYDPTETDIANVDRIELSLAGYQHLRWATGDEDYLQAMLEITPLADQSYYEHLSRLLKMPANEVWSEKLYIFVKYLLDEDSKYAKIPEHDAYLSQHRLSMTMRRNAPKPRTALHVV